MQNVAQLSKVISNLENGGTPAPEQISGAYCFKIGKVPLTGFHSSRKKKEKKSIECFEQCWNQSSGSKT